MNDDKAKREITETEDESFFLSTDIDKDKCINGSRNYGDN